MPADVRLERRDRVAVRDSHDRLRRQMEDRVDLVLAENPLYRVPDRGRRRERHVPGRVEVVANQLGLRHPVADQADDVCAARRSGVAPARLPTSPVAPVTSVGPVAPERAAHSHTLQGASPVPQGLEQALGRAVCPCTARSRRGGRRPAGPPRPAAPAHRPRGSCRRRPDSRRAAGSNTMKPPLIQPSPICGFSVNSVDADHHRRSGRRTGPEDGRR